MNLTVRATGAAVVVAAMISPAAAVADDPVTWIVEGTGDTVAGCTSEWYAPAAEYRLKYAFDPGAAPIEAFPMTAVYAIDVIELEVDGTPVALAWGEIVIEDDLDIPPPSDLYVVATDLFNLTMVGPDSIFTSTALPAVPPDPAAFTDVFLEDDSCLVALTSVTHTVFGGGPDPDPDPETTLEDVSDSIEALVASAAPEIASELEQALSRIDRAQASAATDPPDWPRVLEEMRKALTHVANARDAGLADADADPIEAAVAGLAADLADAAITDAVDGVLADLAGSCFDEKDDRLERLGTALEELEKAEVRVIAEATRDAVKSYGEALEAAETALTTELDPTCLDLEATLPDTPRNVLGDAAAALAARPEADPKVQARLDEALSALGSALDADPWTLSATKKAPDGVAPTAIDAFEAMSKAVSELEKARDDRRATAADVTAIQEAIDAVLASQRYLVEQLVLGARDALTAEVSAREVERKDRGLAILGASYDHVAAATAQTGDGEAAVAADTYTRILIDFTGAGIVIIGDPAGIVIIGDPAG